MTPTEIDTLLNSLSVKDKEYVLDHLKSASERSTRAESRQPERLNHFDFSTMPQILTRELKQQNITYEEMAIQIGVSISTFKRMVANPSASRASNLHALLRELGIRIWLDK